MTTIAAKTEQVDLQVSENRAYPKHLPKSAINKAFRDRFNGEDAPSYLEDVTFRGGKFLVTIPAGLDDDDYTNHLADFEAIVYSEISDIVNDGGIYDYLTEDQLDRL